MKNNHNNNIKLTHICFIFCIALCTLFVVWAYFGRLDIVSMVDGRVAPSSKVKEIQHLEGGIISEILVKEGDIVFINTPLITLEGIASDTSAKELEIRIASLHVEIARLEAFAAEKSKPSFDESFIKMHSELVGQAIDLFNIQMNKYKNELALQYKIVEQRIQAISEIETRIKNNQINLQLFQKQLAISVKLLEDNLTTEYKHLTTLREESTLKGQIAEDKVALLRSKSQLEETQEKYKRIRYTFIEKASAELKKLRPELNERNQRLKKFKDSMRRTTIRSPVKGIIKTLYFNTVGGVVIPGQTVMNIVPTSDNLLVEAHLSIHDIGYVHPGQKVVVKLASRDARRYGKLDGEVIYVSPDAINTQDGGAFYTVRIKTDKNYFEWGESHYNLVSGMQVTSFIHTGRRTVLEYLLDPFVDSISQALQER
jgi:adhesin transport system membrane fusion protein